MGIRVTTDDKGVKVYRKDKVSQAGNPYTTYSLGISSKKQDGTWENAFIDCFFKKGVEVLNKSVINIKDSFALAHEYNGNKSVRLMILDFDVITEGEQPATTAPVTNESDFMKIDEAFEGNLPFN